MLIFATTNLTSCGTSSKDINDTTEVQKTMEAKIDSLVVDTSKKTNDKVPAEVVKCYKFKGETLDQYINITFTSNNLVSGYLGAEIDDKEQGYYSSYSGKFTGKIVGDFINVKGTYEIEGNTQPFSEKWSIDKEKSIIIINNQKHVLAKCQ